MGELVGEAKEFHQAEDLAQEGEVVQGQEALVEDHLEEVLDLQEQGQVEEVHSQGMEDQLMLEDQVLVEELEENQD